MPYPFPAELQHLIQRQLATGNYASEDEVLLDAMSALGERESRFQQWRREIQNRIESLERDNGIELEDEASLRAFAEEIKVEARRTSDVNVPTR